MASGNAGNFQSIPVLHPDKAPIPTTRGSVNIYVSSINGLMYIVDTFRVHTLVKYGTEEKEYIGNITAFAGGGQVNATALIAKFNEVTTCVSNYDSVRLLAAKVGLKQVVFNNTNKILSVYPAVSEQINGVTNLKFNIGEGQVMTFESHKTGFWFTYGVAIPDELT